MAIGCKNMLMRLIFAVPWKMWFLLVAAASVPSSLVWCMAWLQMLALVAHNVVLALWLFLCTRGFNFATLNNKAHYEDICALCSIVLCPFLHSVAPTKLPPCCCFLVVLSNVTLIVLRNPLTALDLDLVFG